MRGIDWTIPKRYLRLTLYDGRVVTTNKRVLSNLDDYFKITGDISATVSGAAAEANFTLYGLKLDKMAFLSTSFSTWVVNQIRNEIVLDIGYENNHGIMFNGTITEALPSLDNENYSVKLKCMGSFAETLNSVVSLSFSGITPVSVIVARIELFTAKSADNESLAVFGGNRGDRLLCRKRYGRRKKERRSYGVGENIQDRLVEYDRIAYPDKRGRKGESPTRSVDQDGTKSPACFGEIPAVVRRSVYRSNDRDVF